MRTRLTNPLFWLKVAWTLFTLPFKLLGPLVMILTGHRRKHEWEKSPWDWGHRKEWIED